jgi:hypothetical protein
MLKTQNIFIGFLCFQKNLGKHIFLFSETENSDEILAWPYTFSNELNKTQFTGTLFLLDCHYRFTPFFLQDTMSLKKASTCACSSLCIVRDIYLFIRSLVGRHTRLSTCNSNHIWNKTIGICPRIQICFKLRAVLHQVPPHRDNFSWTLLENFFISFYSCLYAPNMSLLPGYHILCIGCLRMFQYIGD